MVSKSISKTGAPIHVASHFLPEIPDIADPVLSIDQAKPSVSLALCRCDDRRSIMVGDVVESKGNAMLIRMCLRGTKEIG